MATSKIILFFGKSLQARNSQKTDQHGALDGLSNEFTIKNLNDYPLRYQLVTYSLNGTTENTSSRSVFKFTQAMYDSPLCKNRADTSRMTKLIVDLNGEQELTIKIRFEPSSNGMTSMPHLNGCLRISAIGYSERFKVSLVGFINRFNNHITWPT